jgi:hypothetical protein
LGELPITDAYVKAALVEAVEAALVLGDLERAEQLVAVPERLDSGQLTPLLQAHTARLRARLDAARGAQDHVDEHFNTAAALYGKFGFIFHRAVAQLEHAEWLIAQSGFDEARPLLSDAQHPLEQLQATPWVERTARAAVIPDDQRAPIR